MLLYAGVFYGWYIDGFSLIMKLSKYLAIVDVDVFKDDITEKTKKIVETYKPSIMLRDQKT